MALPYSFDILQAVIEATPDAIFVKDLDGRYVLVNAAAARFLGRSPSDIIGKKDLELYPEETALQFIRDDQQVLATGRAQSFEGVATGQSGTEAYLVTKGVYRDQNGKILGLFGISHDITELRQAHEILEQTQQALFQAQKMEAVGQLTGGIAHDFNNILGVILGNVELLKQHLRQDPQAHELLDSLMRAAKHGQALTSDLLAFSRSRQLNPQPVHVNSLVEDIVRLLSRTLGATIHIVTVTSPDAGVAFVDPTALEAAVLNVALNARDAMPNGGTLTIRTSRLDVPAGTAAQEDLNPGAYAVLALEDTGTGIPPEIVARVFEPFFTTKGSHGGTGLGLSMVYGFTKQSGGTVSIISAPDRGTTVKLFLPLAASDAPPVNLDARPVDAAGVRRTILLVEDETAMRNTLRRQLEALGHQVLAAGSAAEAAQLLGKSQSIDLLFTDVVLGAAASGIDLAMEARACRADLPVIFISGYTAISEGHQRIRQMGAPLFHKPMTMAQLAKAIKTACGDADNDHR
jgi:PAS domain S-box-containing protein